MEEIFTMHILHEQHRTEREELGKVDKADEVNEPNELHDELHEIEFVEWDCCRELAQAYICHQPLEEVFSPIQGLQHGTAFPNLFQPYMGRLVVPPCAKERL
jgi:hypothetical protein